MDREVDVLGWDPLFARVRESLESDARQQLLRLGWRRPPRVWLLQCRLWLVRGWVDGVLVCLTVGLLAWSIVLLATTWPWSTSHEPLTGLAIGSASAAAFGSVVLSALALPVRSASEIAAGYTAEVLRRPFPWLVGVALVGGSAFLFWLAGIGPDREAATAGGLLAAAGFGAVWLATRSILRSADPHELATRQVRFLARRMKMARRIARASVRQQVARPFREASVVDRLSANQQHQFVNGFLRQFREGIRGAIAQGQSVQALTLWNGMLDAFLDYAQERSGDVGPYQGPSQTVLETAREIIHRGLRGDMDDLATGCVGSLIRLGDVDATSPPYRAVLAMGRQVLGQKIDETWSDDYTAVPAEAVRVLGILAAKCFEHRESAEASRYLDDLVERGIRGVTEARIHIGPVAVQGIVSALPAITREEDGPIRRHNLDLWRGRMAKLTSLKAAESKVILFQPATDVLFPGFSLWRDGFPAFLWRARNDNTRVSMELVRVCCSWLEEALPSLARFEDPNSTRLVESGLGAAYNVALFAAGSTPYRVDLAEDLIRATLSWVSQGYPYGSPGRALTDPDIAELLWSTFLAAGYMSHEPRVVADAARWVLGVIAFDDEPLVVRDGYVASYLSGLLIASGVDAATVTLAMDDLTSRPEWIGSSIPRIPGFGRAPSANVNRNAAAPPILIDRINAWAVQSWPSFSLSGQGGDQVSGSDEGEDDG